MKTHRLLEHYFQLHKGELLRYVSESTNSVSGQHEQLFESEIKELWSIPVSKVEKLQNV